MKWLFQFIISIIISIPFAYSQPNLVPNSSFEDYKRCLSIIDDSYIDSLDNVKNWFLVDPLYDGKIWGGAGHGGGGTWGGSGYGHGGHYFNRCSNKNVNALDSAEQGVPKNMAGFQEARTGNAYVTITAFALEFQDIFYQNQLVVTPGLFSEYVTLKLKDYCINRLEYIGGFFVSACGLNNKLLNVSLSSDTFGHRAYTTSSLGMYLCNEIPKLKNDRRIEAKAQINNDINRNLNDTINWMEISGRFEANGTEKYLMLGSFNDSANVKYFNSYGYKEPWLNKIGIGNSYYIDDVSLIPQNTTHYYDTLLCSNSPLQLGAVAQADSFEWNDGNKTDKIRTFSSGGLVWVKSWLYGGTVYMWDSLNIIPNNINSGLPKDTFLCNEQTQLNISTTNANAGATYLWNNVSTGKSLVLNNINWVNGKAQVWLTTTANYCTQTDTITIYQKPALQIPINDTTTCFEDFFQILLDAGANFKSYLWLPTGETSKTVYSNQAQIYKLTVTDSFNCSASKNIIVDELCKAEIFLPNAFTPNGDGKNETYKPILKTKNLLQYELKIYDSWGTAIFTTTDPNQTWDAKNNQQGVYVVTVNYEYKGFGPSLAKGTVTILR